MGSPDLPKAPETPDPVAREITDEVAEDLLVDSMKRKNGRKASFLTKGQNTTTRKTNSLLGSNKKAETKAKLGSG